MRSVPLALRPRLLLERLRSVAPRLTSRARYGQPLSLDATVNYRPLRPTDGRVELRPILIVDDDSTLVQVLADALRSRGYPVVTASNGAEALELVARIRPRLVLLDYHMPQLDGAGFARKLAEKGLRLPIVLMTEDSNGSLRQAAQRVNAGCVLSKPFGVSELLSVISQRDAAA